MLSASDDAAACVSPVDFLSRLEEFCERDDYDFLKEQTDGLYRDHQAFVDAVRERWLDVVESELRTASGLIDERSHLGLFDTYVTHVSHSVKQERVHNPVKTTRWIPMFARRHSKRSTF